MHNYIYYDYLTSQVAGIKEESIDYIKSSSIHNYLNTRCLQHGSTLQGRKESFKYLVHQTKFIPILICQDPLELYFPTSALKDPDCIWINYAQIDHIEKQEKKCVIIFKDQTHLVCDHAKRIEHILIKIRFFLRQMA